VGGFDGFSGATTAWFESTFAAPTVAQLEGWPAIASGRHTLIHAPTGSGKTLAAFLWALDRLSREPTPTERERCRVLYISPLKALAHDVDRNLRAPLHGIRHAAERLGMDVPPITTAMRTGDTPQRDRQSMLRHPPDILITTPESLFLMLTSRAREILTPVRWVIVDEVHSIAGTKRGSHLALSLERLAAITNEEPQRIGLSATQRPLGDIAALLAGGIARGDTWTPRRVAIVDAPRDKELDIEIVVPVADMTRPEETTAPVAVDPTDPGLRSIWPAVYPRLLDLLEAHRSTIFFVNSRGQAERLAAELNRLAGEEVVRSHHGSVSREQRIEIEDRLKSGDLRGVVATSTLELGIDMAAVDLVVLVESPSSVARGLQRVGRAGHQVGAPSVAKVFPKHRADLLETTVVVDRMYAGEIEETAIPRNALDVLAQQIVAIAADATVEVGALFDLVRRALPYRDLTRPVFESVLDMLAGRYPSDEFAELRPRIVWNRAAGTIEGRGNARMLAVTNPGTIPDRGLYRVVVPDGGRVGELDEEMVYESRQGDTVVLGTSAWRIDDITLDQVVVTPAPGATNPRLPFWKGDAPGRPLELGRAVGAFTRRIGALEAADAVETLAGEYRLDRWAAMNLAGFIAEERDTTGVLPTDRTIVVERYRDEIGDWRVAVLTPFGARVHAPWALAARHRYRERRGAEVDLIWADDGMLFRFPDVDEPPGTEELLFEPDEVEEILLAEVADSALFVSRFREAAARSLLLPKRRPGARTPLWQQRRRAASLLEVTRKHGTFPVVLETYREVMQDHFDLPALKEILDDIRKRRTSVAQVDLTGPSPFASSLTFDFVAAFMYDYDAPAAERRAMALTLDRTLLAELLGEPSFRDLLDADVIAAVEDDLQHRSLERRARSLDAIHDLLRDLGPLAEADVAARTTEDTRADLCLAELEAAGRIMAVTIDGEPRFAAVEDAARLRDAIGTAIPQSVPQALLEPVDDPVGDVVSRHARTHGPFTASEAAASIGIPVGVVEAALGRLEAAGRVAGGAYRPGGIEHEWVDVEVLRRIRRRSLAVLRSEVEAVEPVALGRFLPAWQHVGGRSGGADHVNRVAQELRGAAIPASILESDVLADRGAATGIDTALATGDLVWVGRGPLGGRDGRIALYPRNQVPLLLGDPVDDPPEGPIHEVIRDWLASKGASFFADLYHAAGGGDPDAVLDALWDLVWAGEVTNDTLAPVRAFLSGRSTRRDARLPMSSGSPPAGKGRWYPTADLLSGRRPGNEAKATAMAEMLLDRHGIVTRTLALAEGVPGGFNTLYPVLSAMEETGSVRRGYFVEGLGGAQFGHPGAIDRLRSTDDTGIVVLAAADPANPYGAALTWPDHDAGRPARRAGAHVALDDGALVAYVERGGRSALAFTEDPAIFAAALAAVAPRHRRMTVERVDGVAAPGSRWGEPLATAGFIPGYKGLTFDRHRGVP
jgi:ATP-dependent helicase Lhr and Lhr-like helicase